MGVVWSGRRDDDEDPISPILYFIVAHQNLISLITHFIPFFSLTKPKRQSSIQFVDQLRIDKQAPDLVLVLRSHKKSRSKSKMSAAWPAPTLPSPLPFTMLSARVST